MNEKIPYLDGWRGLAILCLLIGHFFPVPGINLGMVGVALFFVLSGLLMARVLFIQKLDIRTFYRRRIARVFPSITVYIAVIVTVFLSSGIPLAFAELIAAMTFTNNYIVISDWTMPFGHIWSLSVEEHSYVILTVAACWCRWRKDSGLRTLGFILSIILSAVVFYSIWSDTDAESWHLRTEVASFGIFSSGFIFLAAMPERYAFTKAWIAPTALVIGILAHWWSVPHQARVILGWGALALSINTMDAAPRWFLMIFESTVLRVMGIYSFSLYLWQQPFYQLVADDEFSPILGMVSSLAAGGIAYYLVENPIRIYLNSHWAKKTETMVSPAAGWR